MISCSYANKCTKSILGDCSLQVQLNENLDKVYNNDSRAEVVLQNEVNSCKSSKLARENETALKT